ncbi:phospholipase D family protein [Paenibacillus sp. YPG26]|uniref:phospholipase D family protein n=1 Tax=Paenibacillus sp. YPG26 TaxID=2878915 RepID=UPI00204169D5|nr:phospholipase D family protein [Paenibacillus sp. YPG26]USB32910.1 phospholipase D family protein [Paenibacillus sp. YPG26]
MAPLSNPRISSQSSRKRSLLSRLLISLAVLTVWLAAVMIYQTHKPLPAGTSYESPLYSVDEVNFLYDLTYPDGKGGVHQERQIVDRVLQMIEEAREYVVLDLFLFNDYVHEGQRYPDVSGEVTRRLIAQKKKHPRLQITFVTDEINTNYGSAPNPLLEQLKQAGAQIVITDVNPLRDSTPAYSAIWRTFIQWFGHSGTGWIPNLMASSGPDITARSYLKLLNVKANHRKVVATENSALISSGNIHNASALHSNIAFEVRGNITADILSSEQAVADFSGGGALPRWQGASSNQGSKGPGGISQTASAPLQIRYLTEGKIYKYLLESIRSTTKGDTLWMGMFYLADSQVLNELVEAGQRGVQIRLILDPNQNAFGQEKIGLLNRPVAQELLERSGQEMQIRWYNTTKEQYHTKLLYIAKAKGPSMVMGGSANFTARNLDDLNLENDLWISVPKGNKLTRDLDHYFNRIWYNEGAEYSLDYSAYHEESVWFKDIMYRLQKGLGFTTN